MSSVFLTVTDRVTRVLAEIDAANRDISDADRRRKYEKMAASPYAFFRGSAHLFWRDHWDDWRHHRFGGVLETQTWLQGDAHVYNFGAYGDDRQGRHYGMDDFDDAVIADYQYDLWRQCVSMVLDIDENVGLDTGQTVRAIRHFLSDYLDTVAEHADGRSAEDIHVDYMADPIGGFMAKVAKKRGPARQLRKWTKTTDDGRVFDTDKPKLAALPAARRSALLRALAEDYPETLQPGVAEAYAPAHFAIKDVARRLDAGTGSLGTARYYALVEGESGGEHDDIILDIKEQQRPSAYACMSTAAKRAWRNRFKHEAARHAEAFTALANHPDEYLGWIELDGSHFSVRQRSPYKKDFPTHKIKGFKSYRRLARQWGRVLAREHLGGARALRPDDPGEFGRGVQARTDARADRERFKRQIVALAIEYAARVADDHAIFVAHRAPDASAG